MPEAEKKRPIARGDLLTGGVIALAGLLALLLALDFDAASRMFPAVTAASLLFAGLGTVAMAIARPGRFRTDIHGVGSAALACLAIAVWAAAFAGGAGFVIPTFLLQIVLLRLTGVRRRGYLLAVAAFVTGLAYLGFIVLLDVPLPPSRLPGIFAEF